MWNMEKKVKTSSKKNQLRSTNPRPIPIKQLQLILKPLKLPVHDRCIDISRLSDKEREECGIYAPRRLEYRVFNPTSVRPGPSSSKVIGGTSKRPRKQNIQELADVGYSNHSKRSKQDEEPPSKLKLLLLDPPVPVKSLDQNVCTTSTSSLPQVASSNSDPSLSQVVPLDIHSTQTVFQFGPNCEPHNDVRVLGPASPMPFDVNSIATHSGIPQNVQVLEFTRSPFIPTRMISYGMMGKQHIILQTVRHSLESSVPNVEKPRQLHRNMRIAPKIVLPVVATNLNRVFNQDQDPVVTKSADCNVDAVDKTPVTNDAPSNGATIVVSLPTPSGPSVAASDNKPKARVRKTRTSHPNASLPPSPQQTIILVNSDGSGREVKTYSVRPDGQPSENAVKPASRSVVTFGPVDKVSSPPEKGDDASGCETGQSSAAGAEVVDRSTDGNVQKVLADEVVSSVPVDTAQKTHQCKAVDAVTATGNVTPPSLPTQKPHQSLPPKVVGVVMPTGNNVTPPSLPAQKTVPAEKPHQSLPPKVVGVVMPTGNNVTPPSLPARKIHQSSPPKAVDAITATGGNVTPPSLPAQKPHQSLPPKVVGVVIPPSSPAQKPRQGSPLKVVGVVIPPSPPAQQPTRVSKVIFPFATRTPRGPPPPVSPPPPTPTSGREQFVANYQSRLATERIAMKVVRNVTLPLRQVQLREMACQTDVMGLIEPGRMIEVNFREKSTAVTLPDTESMIVGDPSVRPSPHVQVPTSLPRVPTPLPRVPTPLPRVPTPLPQVPTPLPQVPTQQPQVPTPLPRVPTPPPQAPTPLQETALPRARAPLKINGKVMAIIPKSLTEESKPTQGNTFVGSKLVLGSETFQVRNVAGKVMALLPKRMLPTATTATPDGPAEKVARLHAPSPSAEPMDCDTSNADHKPPLLGGILLRRATELQATGVDVATFLDTDEKPCDNATATQNRNGGRSEQRLDNDPEKYTVSISNTNLGARMSPRSRNVNAAAGGFLASLRNLNMGSYTVRQAYHDFLACMTREEMTGNMLIHRAAVVGDCKGVELQCFFLSARKVSLDVKNFFGMTPLHLAVTGGHTATAEVLLSFGARLDEMDASGDTALHLAVKSRHAGTLASLLTGEVVPVDEFNDCGFTPLHLCCIFNKVDDCKLLLQHNADPNLKDMHSGRTALYLAVEYERFDLVLQLLEARALPSETNFAGHSPLGLVTEAKIDPRIRALLHCSSRFLTDEPSETC